MKLLFTLWILAVVTQEVFPSTLVRLPRQALSKPTSSVQTEYEATYEQKGKLGNGSYSTVSGKQQVVHNNCGDNWNAFADKCASLIKDLVASLANAVSSKPGDATNLQLRIKNTLTHFDSTDNCTCLNHTKNGLSGVDLSSLFDNITINTVQPPSNNGKNEITPTQQINGNDVQKEETCESCHENNDHHDEEVTANPKVVERPIGQSNLPLINPENVDPENAEAFDEPSNNSRRGAQYPKNMKNPVRVPGKSGDNSKQLPVESPASTNPKEILFPTKATPEPTKVVQPPNGLAVPQTQPKNSWTQPQSPASSPTPQQNSPQTALPVGLPAKSNNVQRPSVLLKPAPAPSSGSQIGSPTALDNEEPQSGTGLGQTPTIAAVKPVTSTIPNNDGGSSPTNGVEPAKAIPIVKPVAPMARPVNGAIAEPLTAPSKGSPLANGAQVKKTPPVIPAVLTPESQSEPESQTALTGEKESPEASETTVIPVVSDIGTESQTTPSDCEEESDETKTPETSKTPVVTPIETKPESDDEEESPKEKSSGTNEAPVVLPVVSDSKSDNGDESHTTPSDCEEESSEEKTSKTDKTPVIATVTSKTGSESTTTPCDSDESKEDSTGSTPIPILAVQSGPQKSATPSDNANVIAKQPQDEQLPEKHSPEVVPVINSNSNLPESSGPVDSAGPVNPSPIYLPLPTTPSPIPSSNQKLEPPVDTEQGVTPGIPTTTECDQTTENNAGETIPVLKEVPVVPAAGSQGSQEPQTVEALPTAGKGGRKPNENIFIVTPVPAYPEKTNPELLKPEDQVTTDTNKPDKIIAKPSKEVPIKDGANQGNQPPVAPVYTAPVKTKVPESHSLTPEDDAPTAGGVAVDEPQHETFLTTPLPVQPIVPITPTATNGQNGVPVVSDEHLPQPNSQGKDSSTPDVALVDSVPTSGNVPSEGSQSGSPVAPEVAKALEPPVDVTKDNDPTKATTFQTTSTEPTPPQRTVQSPPLKTSVPVTQPSSAPQDSYETIHGVPATSPETHVSKDGEDDEDEDCCSCESCTEEEITNPKQYKEIACKDLEEARRELKAIFDKIKKKLKCGRKAPQKIVAS